MNKFEFKTDFGKDVVLDMYAADVLKENLVGSFYIYSQEFNSKYKVEILEQESGIQDDSWETYSSDAQEAYAIVQFTEKYPASFDKPIRTTVIKFYGHHRSHDGTYFEGLKEVKKVVKTIETYE